MKVHRFDKDFFETKPENLSELMAKYPFFFPAQTPDAAWIEKMNNPQWRELYSEVEHQFGDFGKQKNEIETLFKHIKYYFSTVKTPEDRFGLVASSFQTTQ